MQDQIPPVAGGSDVEKGEFIGTLRVVACGDFDRVARITQLDEIDALDHAASGDVKARDDAFVKHGACKKWIEVG